MLWRLTGVRSRMLAWACLACALFLGASGVAIAALYDRMDTRELAAAGALLAAGVALIFASGWGFARSITGLLVTATDFTRQIAAGNLSTPLPPASLRDEIGALKFSLEVMRKSLVSITRDVHQGIESALHSAAEIADGNADLSAHTQRQAASLEEAAASMAQLASTVKQNASSAFEADQKAGQATDAARRRGGGRRGPGHAGASCRARRGFRRSSASSTASPSRPISWRSMPPWKPPGGAGKGFAVVAAEVRSLAQKSGTAAREIKELIETSNQRVAEGVRHVERAGDAMLDIETSVKQVTQIVNEIAAISSEQHTGIDNVSRTISETDTAAQRNAARVEQASLAVENLRTRGAHCAMPSKCSGLQAPRAPCPGVPLRRPSPCPRRAGRFRCWNGSCPENRREPSPAARYPRSLPRSVTCKPTPPPS